jgi:hypothetical protein
VLLVAGMSACSVNISKNTFAFDGHGQFSNEFLKVRKINQNWKTQAQPPGLFELLAIGNPWSLSEDRISEPLRGHVFHKVPSCLCRQSFRTRKRMMNQFFRICQ